MDISFITTPKTAILCTAAVAVAVIGLLMNKRLKARRKVMNMTKEQDFVMKSRSTDATLVIPSRTIEICVSDVESAYHAWKGGMNNIISIICSIIHVITMTICTFDIHLCEHEVLLLGANSLELCSNRMEGGVTPSSGFVEECISRFQVEGLMDIHVLIRPRPGDFNYSGYE
jgi:hypothetical protein